MKIDIRNDIPQFFDISSYLVVIMDEDRKVNYVNESCIKHFKYSKRILLAKKFVDFVHPEDISATLKKVASLNQTKLNETIVNRCKDKEGNYHSISWEIIRGKTKKTVLFIGRNLTKEYELLKDIKDIKKALDESAIVAITNQKGEITYVNDKFCEISKYDRAELIGQDHKIINSGYHSKEFIKNLWKTIATGSIWTGEIKNKAKDGSYYWVDTTIVPFLNDKGKPCQYIAIRSDITEKKKAEGELIRAKRIAEESTKIKEQFLTNMSHEIRTPMNSIVGFTDLLLETKLGTDQLDFLENIKKSGNALLVLINDILDLSKMGSGKLKLEEIEFNLLQLVDQAVKMLEHRAKKKGLDIALYIDSRCPKYIEGDPTRLNQILINLINNAIKFTENGEVNIYVKLGKEKGSKVDIMFKVEDTGIGMDGETQKIIFENFTQARSDTARIYGGSGLGLSIVKMIVEQTQGTINLDSTLGKGSVFSITIPYKKSNQTDSNNDSFFLQQHLIKPKQLDLKDVRILLVEDNLMNQALAKSRLKYWNCEIDIAKNGKIALKKLENNMYDLILMDIQMPEMDGHQTTKAIRKQKNPICNIPIVAMTAHAATSDEEKALNSGMNDYISKPFNPEILYHKIVSNIKTTPNTVQEETFIEKPILEEDFDELIDITYLEEESLGDNELLLFLMRTFISNFKEFLKEVKESIKEEDFETIYKAAHKIKSNVSMIGAKKLQEIISEIHDLSRDGKEMKQIKALISDSEKNFNKINDVLSKKIKQITNGCEKNTNS